MEKCGSEFRCGVTRSVTITQRSGVPVTDRTWVQLMCCAPSRPWCPNFRGQEAKVQGFKSAVDARVNTELTEQ